MTQHYYSENQQTPFEPFLITIGLKDFSYELYSASGIFSLKHLDKGTETLLTYMDLSSLSSNAKVLDLGCGYGVVGITLLKKNPTFNVFFADTNERAIKLVKKNLKLHHLAGKVLRSNMFLNIEETFDLILTNPPYNAGRVVCFGFIEGSFNHLSKGGSLQLVCRRRKGGDVLEKKMGEVFGNVEIIGHKSGFRVYKSIKCS